MRMLRETTTFDDVTENRPVTWNIEEKGIEMVHVPCADEQTARTLVSDRVCEPLREMFRKALLFRPRTQLVVFGTGLLSAVIVFLLLLLLLTRETASCIQPSTIDAGSPPTDETSTILALLASDANADEVCDDEAVSTASTWPIFRNMTQLHQNTAWLDYLTTVYGSIPDSAFPLDTQLLKLLYNNVQGVNVSADCRCLVRGVLSNMGRYPHWDVHGTFWQHDADRTPSAPHSWVEISHCSAAADGKETNSLWAYRTPGSGVFANVGDTIVFRTHGEFLAYFFRKPELVSRVVFHPDQKRRVWMCTAFPNVGCTHHHRHLNRGLKYAESLEAIRAANFDGKLVRVTSVSTITTEKFCNS